MKNNYSLRQFYQFPHWAITRSFAEWSCEWRNLVWFQTRLVLVLTAQSIVHLEICFYLFLLLLTQHLRSFKDSILLLFNIPALWEFWVISRRLLNLDLNRGYPKQNQILTFFVRPISYFIYYQVAFYPVMVVTFSFMILWGILSYLFCESELSEFKTARLETLTLCPLPSNISIHRSVLKSFLSSWHTLCSEMDVINHALDQSIISGSKGNCAKKQTKSSQTHWSSLSWRLVACFVSQIVSTQVLWPSI